LLAAGCWLALTTAPANAVTVQLGAAKDTMIFQNNVNNGAGGAPGFFAGTNSAPSIRRGLLEFDVTSIPITAIITDVQLRLVIGQLAGMGAGVNDPVIGLHKLLVDWGEANTGASTATGLGGIGQGSAAQNGDATWNARFFGSVSPWGQNGGQVGVDYNAAASASLVQGNALNDVSVWTSTPALVADVQSWIGAPSANNGWMLINTDETSAQTFRGFYSRNFNPNNDPNFPDLQNYFPRLTISYTVIPEPASVLLVTVGAAAIILMSRPRHWHIFRSRP
jgi:hypothetical protein